MSRKNRNPEEKARRAKIRELLQMANIDSMDDIQNLFKETIAEFMENGLEAELDEDLGYSKYDYKNKATDNSRNGHSSKNLRTSFGDVEVSVPRDRKGEFEPQLLKKNQTSISQDIEEKILSMYAKGMTTGDIEAHIQDIYGLSVSDTTVSRITDKILPVAKEWQQRPLESIYAVVFLDAIHYHVRSEGQIVKKAVYIAIGLDLDGRKDVLGMWVGENESAKFVTAQPQPSSKNKAGAKSGSSKFSFCKCRAACPTTAADHVRTCGHSDYALGHKDVLQSRPVKNENTHTASNDWPWPFLQCCRESHWIVPLWGC